MKDVMRSVVLSRPIGIVSSIVIAGTALLCTASTLHADEGAVAGRSILSKYQDAVLTVKLVIKQGMTVAGRDTNKTESKSEATGTVIDPSGLTVISLTDTDPGDLLGDMMGGGDDEDMKFKMESEVTDVKLILPDATEVPAKIVLRDKDLDLAFIRPVSKLAKPLTFVDLAADSKPKILDELIVLNRLGKVANRAPAVSLDRVESMIEKPRTFYVPGRGASSGGLGSPVFTYDGKLVGLQLLRSIKMEGRPDFTSMLSGLGGLGIIPVILPASDIAEAAKQAPEVDKADTPKPEDKKSK